jgi:hypothetical protein
MAVTAEALSSEFILRVEDGMTATGATRYANLTYRNVKAEATDNDVKAIADQLAEAQTKPVVNILRTNTLTLTGEPV